jgi:hypothetical protein
LTFLGKKHLPVNPLDKGKYSSTRNLSKDEKRRRIASFIDELPTKMIRKMQKIEHLQEEIFEDQDYECPFAPALCNRSRDIVERRRIPKIQNRYENEWRDRQRRLEQERLDKEKREMELYQSMQIHRPSKRRRYSSAKKSRRNSTFTSNRKKRRTSYARNQEESASPERTLYDTQKEWLDRRDAKILERKMEIADRELMEGDGYTFAPRINRRSSQKIKMSFQDRQEMYKKKKDRNIQKLNQSLDSFSF